MSRNPVDVWPLDQDGADPWGEHEWAPVVPREGVERGVAGAFEAAWQAVLRGTGGLDDPRLDPPGLDLWSPEELEQVRAWHPAPEPVHDELLADIVEDRVPDGVPAAADRCLGPFADVADGHRLRRVAATAMAFAPLLGHQKRALDAWRKDRPRTPQRESANVASRAPVTLWLDPPAWRPAWPLGAAHLPVGPLSLTPEPLVPGMAVRALVGRVYPVVDGSWHGTGIVGLPVVPRLDRLHARLRLEQARLRLERGRVTWEEVLRVRGEVVYRWCARAVWARLEVG